MVLLHGFPHTWRVWEPVMEDLATDHRVAAVDLRGFGASTRTATGMDGETMSYDVEELIVALDRGPVTLAAIDAGVPAAFLLGMRRPDLRERLVLVRGPAVTGAEDRQDVSASPVRTVPGPSTRA